MSALAVALTGNPNTGKSTIFNALTGARQKIGNWPGVTFDKKVGHAHYKGRAISIVDLPETYSINARSPEDKIVIDYLTDTKLDLVLDVVDSSNIERNLFLTVQLLEKGIPLLIDLNMQDDAERRGIRIDTAKLEEALGMPVVKTTGRSSKSTKHLLDVFTNTVMANYRPSKRVEEHIAKIRAIEESARSELEKEEAVIEARYALIDQVVAYAVTTQNVGMTRSEKIDRVLANGVFALPIFLLILYAVFQITFTWIGQPIADALEALINDDLLHFVKDALVSVGVADWMVSLVTDGVISGVGSVLTFVSLIFVLFFCLSFLDGTGYMARIAFIMDPIMHRCGLTGKGIMPLMMGFGCAVPSHRSSSGSCRIITSVARARSRTASSLCSVAGCRISLRSKGSRRGRRALRFSRALWQRRRSSPRSAFSIVRAMSRPRRRMLPIRHRRCSRRGWARRSRVFQHLPSWCSHSSTRHALRPSVRSRRRQASGSGLRSLPSICLRLHGLFRFLCIRLAECLDFDVRHKRKGFVWQPISSVHS